MKDLHPKERYYNSQVIPNMKDRPHKKVPLMIIMQSDHQK